MPLFFARFLSKPAPNQTDPKLPAGATLVNLFPWVASSCLTIAILGSGCNRTEQNPGGESTPPGQASSANETVKNATSSGSPLLAIEPRTAQEAIQAMQQNLEASIATHRTKEPAPSDVEATIAFGLQQQQRFPNDDSLAQALGAMMFQSVRYLQDKPEQLKERRLALGRLVDSLKDRAGLDPEVRATLSFLLLEESKGHLQNDDSESAWKSILEARELGFRQSKLLYLDPALEFLLEDPKFSAQAQTWLTAEIDEAIARENPGPFQFEMRSLESPDGEEPPSITLADFQDKQIMLLDFWGTWAPPCRVGVSHLVELQKTFSKELGIAGMTFEQPIATATYEDTKARLTEFRKSQPMNYVCGYGNFNPQEHIPNFQGFPTMVLVEPQTGRIRLTLSGYHPAPVLELAVRRVLASLAEGQPVGESTAP